MKHFRSESNIHCIDNGLIPRTMERTTMRPESQCLHMLAVTPSPEEEAGGLRTIYWRLESAGRRGYCLAPVYSV